jgi:acetyl/propionyl-CoA carboxylase alpha subunit
LRTLHGALPEGVVLVGPTPSALERVRDRLGLRRACIEESLRFVAGPLEAPAKLPDAIEAAEAIGYPIYLRPAHGQTGLVGVRCDDDDELMKAWDEHAKAAAAHGTTLTVERFIERARAVEVILVSDSTGETVAIAETERTLGSASGDLIEESPAPFIAARADGDAIRFSLFDSAIRVVEPLASPGLATVTFLFDEDGHAFISDVVLGLTRSHSTAELVTGLDLVAIELAVIKGLPLPDEVHTVQPSGAGLFASLRADAPVPHVPCFRSPPAPQRKIRVDASVQDESASPVDDGALLCRIGSYAPIRHQALLLLDRMIAETEVTDVRTNQKILRGLLSDEAVRAGQYDASTPARVRPYV